MSSYGLVNASNHTLKGLARSALQEVVGTSGNHVLHSLCPTHGRCELSDEVGLDIGRICVRLTINILINWALRSRELSLLDSCLEFILGRLHQWRMECSTNLEGQCTLGSCSLEFLACLVDGLNIS